LSWREHAPEPSRLWIRWTPKRWPAADLPYLDLAGRRIEWPGPAPAAGDQELWVAEPARKDLIAIPPLDAPRAAERDALVSTLQQSGSAVLVQTSRAEVPAQGDVVVLDLLAAVLGESDPFSGWIPPRAPLWVVLPLLPGVLDEAELDRWLGRIAALSPAATLGVAPELQPLDRRRIADALDETLYEEVFHSEAPSERRFARRAAERGLQVFAGRPASTGAPPRLRRNRELAAALAETGELWLKLGRAEPEGQSLLAAARHLEGTPLDFAALAREGNLGVVSWLSATARALIEERVASGRSATLEALRAAWLRGDGG
jgi:hypothetical protein